MAVSSQPLVTIITRTRDRHALLRRALESVLNQELQSWEQIIVNDGGDASALDLLLETYADRYQGRLKVIHNPTSLGMQAASNVALEVARGTYVAVHDDDDAWNPAFLATTTKFLEEQGPGSRYKGVITHTVKVWEDVDARGNVVEVEREDYLPLPEINLLRTGFENPFPPIAFVYRREVHKEIGLFNQAFDVAGDLDFNVRFLLRYEIGVIPQKLAYYHWRRKSRDSGLHNSVTAHAREHGIRLNEWMNHYLRSHADGEVSRIAEAINMARHLIATQGKADQAIERIADLKLFTGDTIRGLSQELARLDEHRERLNDLKQHLESLTGIGEGTYPLLQDLKEHLNSLNGQIAEQVTVATDQQQRLADLKLHLNSLTWLSESALPQFKDLKEHLNSLNGQIAQQAATASDQIQRLTDLKAHLNSFNGAFETIQNVDLPAIKAHLAGISWVQEQHAGLHQANEARLRDLKEHLTSVSNAIVGEVLPQLRELKEMRKELTALREKMDDYSKEWHIFGLRIRWKGGKKTQ